MAEIESKQGINFKYISTAEEAKNLVKSLIDQPVRVVGLAMEGERLGPLGELSLVQLATLDGKIYVFDICSCPEIMTDKLMLPRIFKKVTITKVIHNCALFFASIVSAGCILTKVFDTQCAYAVIRSGFRGVSPYDVNSTMNLQDICEHFGNPTPESATAYVLNAYHSKSLCHFNWMNRPLPDDDICLAAAHAGCLVPDVYNSMLSSIPMKERTAFYDMCMVKCFYHIDPEEFHRGRAEIVRCFELVRRAFPNNRKQRCAPCPGSMLSFPDKPLAAVKKDACPVVSNDTNQNEEENPRPEVVNPRPEVDKPRPEVVNPRPEVVNPRPEEVNPRPEVVNPRPEVDNPRPEVDNPRPEVDNPRPLVINSRPEVDIEMLSELVRFFSAPITLAPYGNRFEDTNDDKVCDSSNNAKRKEANHSPSPNHHKRCCHSQTNVIPPQKPQNNVDLDTDYENVAIVLDDGLVTDEQNQTSEERASNNKKQCVCPEVKTNHCCDEEHNGCSDWVSYCRNYFKSGSRDTDEKASSAKAAKHPVKICPVCKRPKKKQKCWFCE